MKLYEKKDNKFLSLLSFSGKYKYLTIIGCILAGISAVLGLIPFIYIWKMIEEIILVMPNYSNAVNLAHYGWMALFYGILSIGIYFVALMCTHLSAFRNERNMKIITMNHLLKLPLGFFSNKSSGSLRKIIDYSSATTEGFLAHSLPDLISALVTPIAFLVLLFSYNWFFGALSLIPMTIALLILMPMMRGSNKEMLIKYQESLEDMNSEAVEYVRGIPVTKTFQQSIFSFKNFHKTIKDYSKFVTSYSISCQVPYTCFTVSINGFFALLIPAGILLIGSTFNPSLFLDLIFYIILTPIASLIMNKIMFSSQNWMIAKQSLLKIEKILDTKPLEESKNPQHIKSHQINFNNVSFKYPGNTKETLKNINFEIKENETIALVGPSGGGKTTLATLIPRFWDVDSGEILIGDVNVKNIKEKELMKNISFIFQKTQLFKNSILNNVLIAKKDAKKSEVLEALSAAQCDDIIKKLPDGIDTVIGKSGVHLSGGEQQRIALARVILKDAPIIILDEATAFADPENEYKIQKAFKKITEGKTVLIIAHRLSTIKNVDKILVIQSGEIIESGPHNELIEADGFYKNMWDNYNESVQWKVKNFQSPINLDNEKEGV
ncbi:ABC transporter ATP-binding protein [Methanobrevibacter arboriphilus]|jgi:ATP-binding cassette subfamily B protein|uniref:ABC transporter ATP-binding protein n=2 Tax=Methanobrevibacter arboriphilus TaxID=39441 RepID=A0ACA8R288_METAZ|nr:ABC transporter ATP-binding protein [Methanobrevibacter arboriphilus]BBL61439.1 ABC transporter ATP-binding protein [Methanobrevibacter arboriphilus]GLI11230.1 ABC transporter ATP-binding protein [Methanobrevibacter arboriphilus]